MRFVVIGGGIAGVTCAEKIVELCPDANVTLITMSDVLKAVSNLKLVGQSMEQFDVVERPMKAVGGGKVHVVRGRVERIDGPNQVCSGITTKHNPQTIYLKDTTIPYDRLCIATGARPNMLLPYHPLVLGLRDTETVQNLRSKLSKARRVVICGNGGIAMQLVHAITFCDVVWVIRDHFVGHAFLDEGAAEFVMPQLLKRIREEEQSAKRVCAEKEMEKEPQGSLRIEYKNTLQAVVDETGLVHSVVDSTVTEGPEIPGVWPVVAVLNSGTRIGCDFIVSATGVLPNGDRTAPSGTALAPDGGIVVDCGLRASMPGVYAAGDVMTPDPAEPWSNTWMHMRLWTQARSQGAFAALHMVGDDEEGEQRWKGYKGCVCDPEIREQAKDELELSFSFEIFSHVTRFFGQRVVLLGKYNGQGFLPTDNVRVHQRVSDTEYVKVYVVNSRVQGGVFVGDTPLAETFENLILSQTDVSMFQDQLLHPDFDIGEYFD